MNITPSSLVNAFHKSEVARKDLLDDLSAKLKSPTLIKAQPKTAKFSPRFKTLCREMEVENNG